MIADEIQPRRNAQRRWLSNSPLHAAAKLNQRTVRERRSIKHVPPGDSCGSESFQQIAFSRANDRRMTPLQVREDRDISHLSRMRRLGGGRARPTNRDTLCQADPKAANPVDPQHGHRPVRLGAIGGQWMSKEAKHDERLQTAQRIAGQQSIAFNLQFIRRLLRFVGHLASRMKQPEPDESKEMTNQNSPSNRSITA